MVSPIDTVKGRIVDYDPYTNEVIIRARYDDVFTMVKREYKECLIQMLDSRPLSEKQRKACYSLIRAISEFSGMEVERTKQLMKIQFIAEDLQETADKIFSLSNASMSLVCAFLQFLIDFILSWQIPTRFPLLNVVDDIGAYEYSCLRNKVCCICGTKADLHHVETVGMGRNRSEIVHEGMRVLPLCRTHHTEAHTLGKIRFNEKYHLDDGIPLDKALCKLYGLKMNVDKIEMEEVC